MKPQIRRWKGKPPLAGSRGFTLVVVISLMVLLSLLAVAMLGLSTVSVRGGANSNHAAVAKANARLAMLMAIGQLQKVMGPDRGVTATASAVLGDPAQPRLTGAWKGWHWEPVAPGAPSYEDKAATFAGWLVSASDTTAARALAYAGTPRTPGADAVELVGAGDDGGGLPNQVVVEKVRMDGAAGGGKLGWAVFDESTKAAIHLEGRGTRAAGALEIAGRKAPDRVRADILARELAGLGTPRNFISLSSAEVAMGGGPDGGLRRRFHDLTTDSLGLLTDTARGGLKRDLSQWFAEETLPAGLKDHPGPYPAAFEGASSAPRWAYLQSHCRKPHNVTARGAELVYDLDSRHAAATDMAVNRNGSDATPQVERLLPVIAKFQMLFSVVGHEPFAVDTRRQFLDANGDPRGYRNYATIHLAYDPVVTLFNPYDVSLDLSKLRLRIWDPPVGFRFRKIDNRTGVVADFRNGGGFDGLAQFQIKNETRADARKCFTLVLSEGDGQGLTGDLRLRPGEVRVFSPRIEHSWTWGVETQGGYSSNSQATFFDWSADKDFGNRDNRRSARFGNLGVECAPGWDPRAGLQTDHLSQLGANRPVASLYPFELGRRDGFVTIRLTDEVEVESKPMVKSGRSRTDFQVDILAGNREGDNPVNIASDHTNRGVSTDTLRSFRFQFAATDLAAEVSANPDYPVITRRFMGADLMQADDDRTVGGKKPFAMLELTARGTRDPLNDSKPWLFNNPVVEGAVQDTRAAGLAHQSYDLRFTEISSFNNFPDGVSVDPDSSRGYFGAGGSVAEGSSFVQMHHVPVAAIASMGDLVHANLVAGSELPRVMHPLGNARAHPLLPPSAVAFRTGTSWLLDHSYLINDGMWDAFFFSGFVDGSSGASGVVGDRRSLRELLRDGIEGGDPGLNARMKLLPSFLSPDELPEHLAGRGAVERGREIAVHFGVDGAFNVNSTSVDAWRAVLSSLRDRAVEGMKVDAAGQVSAAELGGSGRTPFARSNRPMGEGAGSASSRWAGFVSLTDDEVARLADAITREIRRRGAKDGAPSMSLGEFVNRRVGQAGEIHVLAGLLQTAIDLSGINDEAHQEVSKPIEPAAVSSARKLGLANPEAMKGHSGEGSPALLTQGDLMAVLAPVATVRGDTFKIRAYGEATAADGTTVLARAWCEAVVQRLPAHIDGADAPETATPDLKQAVNRAFGRRFAIASFRWLDEEEV